MIRGGGKRPPLSSSEQRTRYTSKQHQKRSLLLPSLLPSLISFLPTFWKGKGGEGNNTPSMLVDSESAAAKAGCRSSSSSSTASLRAAAGGDRHHGRWLSLPRSLPHRRQQQPGKEGRGGNTLSHTGGRREEEERGQREGGGGGGGDLPRLPFLLRLHSLLSSRGKQKKGGEREEIKGRGRETRRRGEKRLRSSSSSIIVPSPALRGGKDWRRTRDRGRHKPRTQEKKNQERKGGYRERKGGKRLQY